MPTGFQRICWDGGCLPSLPAYTPIGVGYLLDLPKAPVAEAEKTFALGTYVNVILVPSELRSNLKVGMRDETAWQVHRELRASNR